MDRKGQFHGFLFESNSLQNLHTYLQAGPPPPKPPLRCFTEAYLRNFLVEVKKKGGSISFG